MEPVWSPSASSLASSEWSWKEQPPTASPHSTATAAASISDRRKRPLLLLYGDWALACRLPQASTWIFRSMSDTASIEHPAWLTGGDFTEAEEPVRLFAAWFAEAKKAEPVNPDAMALATVDSNGLPNSRMVLLKGFDERGFVFYTNVDSIKGHELAAAPKAALTFYWKTLQRQVRARGAVEPVSQAEGSHTLPH